MDTQHEQGEATMLRALARLAREAGSSDTPATHATALLEQLLACCGAHSGAILLTAQRPPLTTKAWHIFALSHMLEEDTRALLVTLPDGSHSFSTPAEKSGWLLWQIPILAPTSGYGEDHTHAPWSALIVLGWHTSLTHEPPPIEQARRLLPQVVDGVQAVITAILLAERVRELEAISRRRAVREMELLKSELLATVSHELRSPLASIKGYAATLLRHERRISREERHEFLLAISESSDRLAKVIDHLLAMSQLDTGGIEIQHVAINMAYLVRESITALEQRIAAIGSSAHYSFVLRLENAQGQATHEEPLIFADRQRLRELLDNLLENAVRYSPDGGMIEVALRPILLQRTAASSSRAALEPPQPGRADNQDRFASPIDEPLLEIRVRDAGIGIPHEQLERIFDRFHRVDTRLTREVNGLGLGLAICKRIVQLHGGMIWAESDPGAGSVFHVWLPA